MRALWLTDIHLNFLDGPKLHRFLERLCAAGPEALLVAGDIGEADSVFEYLDLLDRTLSVSIYFVLGNHDYYGASIEYVRSQMPRFLARRERLCWLSGAAAPVSLTEQTALIGHDGWADGRLGDYQHSSVELSDFTTISEFFLCNKQVRQQRMSVLADAAAEHVRRVLPAALAGHRKVIIVTHVPPFAGAAWWRGKPSDDNYLPYFASQVMGEVLLSVMREHPEQEALVLCGHTHGSGRFQPLPNLTVITGAARYGAPKVQGQVPLE